MKNIPNKKKDDNALDEKKEEFTEKNDELEGIRLLIDNKNKIIESLRADFETSITELEKSKNFLIEKENDF